jgi:hypothetical protein
LNNLHFFHCSNSNALNPSIKKNRMRLRRYFDGYVESLEFQWTVTVGMVSCLFLSIWSFPNIFFQQTGTLFYLFSYLQVIVRERQDYLYKHAMIPTRHDKLERLRHSPPYMLLFYAIQEILFYYVFLKAVLGSFWSVFFFIILHHPYTFVPLVQTFLASQVFFLIFYFTTTSLTLVYPCVICTLLHFTWNYNLTSNVNVQDWIEPCERLTHTQLTMSNSHTKRNMVKRNNVQQCVTRSNEYQSLPFILLTTIVE